MRGTKMFISRLREKSRSWQNVDQNLKMETSKSQLLFVVYLALCESGRVRLERSSKFFGPYGAAIQPY